MTTLKLSEAIREGCKYGPKIEFRRHDDKGASCALGAAENGIAGRALSISSYDWNFHAERVWPLLKSRQVHPISKEIDNLNCIIADLNNFHAWSRETISEFVEVIERKLGLWDEPVKADSPVVMEAVKASLE